MGRTKTLSGGRVSTTSVNWPADLKMTRDLLYRTLYGSRAAIEEAMLQAGLFAEQLGSAEARETMQAFLEKRPPDYSKLG